MRTSKERRICIICEGFEEVEYLDALINKAVFSDKYEFVLINRPCQDYCVNFLEQNRQTWQTGTKCWFSTCFNNLTYDIIIAC